MEPILPMPQSPERPPAQTPVNVEATPVTPERVGELSPPPVTSPIAPPPPVPLPQAQSVGVQSGSSVVVSDDSPMIADDVDVMEKEWVDKAKRIVHATKDDPHQQEKEVSKLQADYLMKRYNKKIKLAE